MMAWLVALILPALVSAITIEGLRRSQVSTALADLPNERSLHERPRPRVGGLGLVAGAFPVAFALSGMELVWPLGLALGLAVLSYLDDRQSLPIVVRLPAHFACAAAVVLVSAGAAPWWLVVVAIGAIAWMTNLFNFMDGADGLAGGMGLAGFATLAAAAALAGDRATAWTCAALASACFGFLLHNFPPARVFLGDAGSIPLGFLAGAIGVQGIARGLWPAWFPLVAFAPFIVDASATLVRRAARGEAFWRAHRTHAYQRLVLGGWSHRRLATFAYALMSLSSVCALWALYRDGTGRWAIISGWTAALLLLYGALELKLGRSAPPSLPGQDR
jgi:phospho-N-acetylmuramoyl-pentapeptide-transferase